MTASPTSPPVSDHPVQPPKAQRRWPKRVGMGAALVVALGVGAAIGATGASNTSAVNAANQKLAAAQRQLGTLRSQVSTLQSQATTLHAQYQQAKTSAQNATTIADQKASIAWTTRNAQLDQKAATLKQQQATLNAQTGAVAANTISQDGVYVVGRDIKGGTWHTTGGGQCYYAKLGSTDTSNIIDNNNITGPATVDLGGAYAFDISGGCTWVKIG
jgi:hypothetical protein